MFEDKYKKLGGKLKRVPIKKCIRVYTKKNIPKHPPETIDKERCCT
jgi:hypothetical protein